MIFALAVAATKSVAAFFTTSWKLAGSMVLPATAGVTVKALAPSARITLALAAGVPSVEASSAT